MANFLSDEVLDPVIVEVDHCLCDRLRVDVELVATYLAARDLEDEKGSPASGKGSHGRISASFIAE